MKKLITISICILMLSACTNARINSNNGEQIINKVSKNTEQKTQELSLEQDKLSLEQNKKTFTDNSRGKLHYKNKAIVLTYHHINKRAGGITITPERFEKDLVMLRDNGFNVIPLRDIIEGMNGEKKIPDNAVAITFDDGYESFYKYAYPLLQKYNVPATVFIVTSWCSDEPVENPGGHNFLAVSQIKDMLVSGLVDVQSHTNNLHSKVIKNPEGKLGSAISSKIYYRDPGKYESDEEYRRRVIGDLSQSRDFFKNKIGYEANILCLPFGVYNNETINISNEAGFKYLVTTISGINKQDSKKNIIWRIRAGDAKLNPGQLKQNIINCANNVKK